jgi:hypothetical protein
LHRMPRASLGASVAGLSLPRAFILRSGFLLAIGARGECEPRSWLSRKPGRPRSRQCARAARFRRKRVKPSDVALLLLRSSAKPRPLGGMTDRYRAHRLPARHPTRAAGPSGVRDRRSFGREHQAWLKSPAEGSSYRWSGLGGRSNHLLSGSAARSAP